MANRFDIQESEGIIVSGLESGGKADKAGLVVGDIIKEINHKPVKTLNDYTEAIAMVESGDSIQMFVRRRNAGFLVIKIIK